MKQDIAIIRPFKYDDSETGNKASLTLSPRYSIFKINNIEYYFLRESGEFDGIGKAVESIGPILAYDGE